MTIVSREGEGEKKVLWKIAVSPLRCSIRLRPFSFKSYPQTTANSSLFPEFLGPDNLSIIHISFPVYYYSSSRTVARPTTVVLYVKVYTRACTYIYVRSNERDEYLLRFTHD